jgi:hypothetical protein
MAKRICTILGAVLLLVGVVGFVNHDLMGTHLSTTHNLVHIISGALALYLGLKGTLGAARTFCLVFGAVYLLLGVAGFLFGGQGTPGVPGPADSRLLKVLPNVLELGTVDHVIHILLGILFLIGGLLTKADLHRATDRVADRA